MINKQDAIGFLKKHQPLPDDKDLSRNIIDQYDEIRRYFLDNPDDLCIPLFLNSFGERDGFGVYQLIGDVIAKHNKEVVLPYLLLSLESKHRSIRYWNAQIAMMFPDGRLFEPLKKLLSENDVDIRFASITAISQLALAGIRREEIVNLLQEMVINEVEDDVLEFIQEVLKDLNSSRN